MILFEPPTSEHISARTIFDPITALAPATDCRTYAIGYLSTLELHGSNRKANEMYQVPERVYLDCESPPPIYDSPHTDDFSRAFADSLACLACVFIKTEIGHVGNTIFEW